MTETLFIRAHPDGRKIPSWVNVDKLGEFPKIIIIFPVIALTQEELHKWFKERCKYFVKMPWW